METHIEKFEGFKPIYKGIPPFMKFEDGYGFYGVLLEEEETGKLQCHLCGHTVLNIAQHLRHKHKDVKPNDYKIKTGLSLGTPLLSETSRKKIKNNFLNLTPEKREEIIKRLQNFNKKLHRDKTKRQREAKASIQTNNRYGTCPEQVRSQFYEIYTKLGRLPNWLELTGRLRYIIESRFGTYEEAVVVWGIPRQEYQEHISNAKENAKNARAENDYFPKFTEEEVRKVYQDFFTLKKRLPTWGEVKTNNMPGRVPFKRVFGCEKRVLEMQLKGY
jgi:hypothetical protein